MKLALLILAVLALVWLLRTASRPRVRPPGQDPGTKRPEVQAMVACSHCGVLMPRDEVLPGRGGVFCSAAHRDAFESSHADP
ncbi:MAG: PP0621 family protein [Burkholderiaceae bacterium]